MRFLPVNETVFLTELSNLDETLALFDSLKAKPIIGIKELIPAARTIMVAYDPMKVSLTALLTQIKQRDLFSKRAITSDIIEIKVRYDGEDIEDVADYLQLSRDELIDRHKAAEFMVAFTGFAPGFAYMTCSDPIFDVPRKKTPRTRIPAGSLGLAGRFSGIYPQASPGGWQLIGTTDTLMFDLQRQPASFLKPGDRVRFVQDTKPYVAQNHEDDKKQLVATPLKAGKDLKPLIKVQNTAFAIYFEDNGRPYQADQGISPSGAIDKSSFMAANHLVGNDCDEAVLEITFGSVEFEVLDNTTIAVTGADCAADIYTQNGKKIVLLANRPMAVEKGDIIKIAPANAGLRCYFAVRAGFHVDKIMASSSRDILANIGPQPIKAGDILYAGGKKPSTVVALNHSPSFAMPKSGDVVNIDVILGPRADWFTSEAVDLFLNQKWEITAQSDRVGNRLHGAQVLERKINDELPSEGTAIGSIQVPASGQPVLFLADHPLTGGYPVIACVAKHHIDLVGQLPVGAFIKFASQAPFQQLY